MNNYLIFGNSLKVFVNGLRRDLPTKIFGTKNYAAGFVKIAECCASHAYSMCPHKESTIGLHQCKSFSAIIWNTEPFCSEKKSSTSPNVLRDKCELYFWPG